MGTSHGNSRPFRDRAETKQSFLDFATSNTYLKFCHKIDEVVRATEVEPLGRTEMDGAWAQHLTWLCEADRKSMYMYLGYEMNQNNVLGDLEDAEQTMKSVLQHAVAMRLKYPGQEQSEKYWAEKGAIESAKDRTIDVVCINDTCVEHQLNPPEDIIVEKDYPTRSKDCQGLDAVAEESEYDDAYSDSIP